MRKRKKLLCALAVMGIITLGAPVAEVQSAFRLATVEADASEARAYIYEWYYKVIDGHLYKRLYNATTEQWVGDWILIE